MNTSHFHRDCYEHEALGSSKHGKMSLQLQVQKFSFQPETVEGPFSLVPPMIDTCDLELHVNRHQIRIDSRETNFPRLSIEQVCGISLEATPTIGIFSCAGQSPLGESLN